MHINIYLDSWYGKSQSICKYIIFSVLRTKTYIFDFIFLVDPIYQLRFAPIQCYIIKNKLCLTKLFMPNRAHHNCYWHIDRLNLRLHIRVVRWFGLFSSDPNGFNLYCGSGLFKYNKKPKPPNASRFTCLTSIQINIK